MSVTPTNQIGEEPRDWAPCPEGELRSMVRRLNARDARRQHRDTLKLAGATALGVALLVVSVGLLSGRAGSITCAECVAQFDDYERHVAGEASMSNPMLGLVEAHLGWCEKCHAYYESKRPGLLEAAGVKLSAAAAAFILAAPRRRDLAHRPRR